MADWRELYKATLLETNPTQLEQLITDSYASSAPVADLGDVGAVAGED